MEQQAEGQRGRNREWWDEVREKRPHYVHE